MEYKDSISKKNPLIVGWREWVGLPELGLPAIKAKIDTGAKTSSLHAFDITRFRRSGADYVRFSVHPLQNKNIPVIECTAPLLDERYICNSGGHRELRYIIVTRLFLGNIERLIEVTLTNRDLMRFRMLLGRSAIKGLAVVNPAVSYTRGKIKAKSLYKKISQKGK